MELQNILTSTEVGELTYKARAKLLPGNTVADAADVMRTRSHGSALICEEEKLVGIFTERDLLRHIANNGNMEIVISEVMTANPETVQSTDHLSDVVRLMDEGGYRRLPVVNPDGSPIGFVDVKTIVHFLVQHFPEAIYNQASHTQLIAKHREGA